MIKVYHLSRLDRNDWRYDAVHYPTLAEPPVEYSNIDDVTGLAILDLIAEGQYELAAKVDTNDMDKAFELTNTIGVLPWHQNPSFTVQAEMTSLRSTSVGDIMVTSEGAFLVDRIGFTRLKGLL